MKSSVPTQQKTSEPAFQKSVFPLRILWFIVGFFGGAMSIVFFFGNDISLSFLKKNSYSEPPLKPEPISTHFDKLIPRVEISPDSQLYRYSVAGMLPISVTVPFWDNNSMWGVAPTDYFHDHKTYHEMLSNTWQTNHCVSLLHVEEGRASEDKPVDVKIMISADTRMDYPEDLAGGAENGVNRDTAFNLTLDGTYIETEGVGRGWSAVTPWITRFPYNGQERLYRDVMHQFSLPEPNDTNNPLAYLMNINNFLKITEKTLSEKFRKVSRSQSVVYHLNHAFIRVRTVLWRVPLSHDPETPDENVNDFGAIEVTVDMLGQQRWKDGVDLKKFDAVQDYQRTNPKSRDGK